MSKKQILGLGPSYACHVFAARDLAVIAGICEGDPLTGRDTACAGDIYTLAPSADPVQLAVHDHAAAQRGAGRFMARSAGGASVAEGSDIGAPGDRVTLDARYTFMTSGADKVDILLISVTPSGDAGHGALHFLPLTPIEAGVQYTLISTDADPGTVRLADIASVAFTRGTRITLADGRQRPVESLTPGDSILTRDHGPQPLRWIGQRSVRAIGPYAPVVIPKGLMGNAGDLIVSQQQRLFIYQRGRNLRTPTAEILVRAKYLADDDTIFIRRGGYAEYFHLVFDHHEIIYAECIPTESLLVDERMLAALPGEALSKATGRLPARGQRQSFGTEASRMMMTELGIAAHLKPARSFGRSRIAPST